MKFDVDRFTTQNSQLIPINQGKRKQLAMAAKGAHITPNIEVKPSLFEVLAADSLNITFYPAIKRVVDVSNAYSPCASFRMLMIVLLVFSDSETGCLWRFGSILRRVLSCV